MLVWDDSDWGYDTATKNVNGKIINTFPCFFYHSGGITAWSGDLNSYSNWVNAYGEESRMQGSERARRERDIRNDSTWCQCELCRG